MKIEYQNRIYKKSGHRLYFEKIKQEISKSFFTGEKIDVLDAGCGNGDLINYLSKYFKNFNYSGIEISKKLFSSLKKRYKKNNNFKFYNSSIQNHKKKYDLVIASGLTGYFEEVDSLFNRLHNLLKKKEKSKIILFDNFNEYGVEKIVRFRVHHNDAWLSGHNKTSIKRVFNFFKKKKYKISFKKFIFPKKIKKTNDPIRSYTCKEEGKKNILISKAGLIFTFYVVTITK